MSWLFLQPVSQSPQRHRRSRGAESDTKHLAASSLARMRFSLLASINTFPPSPRREHWGEVRRVSSPRNSLAGEGAHASRARCGFPPSKTPWQEEFEPFGWFSAHHNRKIWPVSSVGLNVGIAPSPCSCSPAVPPSTDGCNKNWYIEILYIALHATIQSQIVSSL